MLGDYYVIRPQNPGPLAGNLVPDQRTCTSSAPQAKPAGNLARDHLQCVSAAGAASPNVISAAGAAW